MPGYRRIHLPAPLHEQIKQHVENSNAYRSVDQLCREAAEALIQENNLTKTHASGRNKTVWKTANIPTEHYQKIHAWIKTGKAPYTSVNEALRDAIRKKIQMKL